MKTNWLCKTLDSI